MALHSAGQLMSTRMSEATITLDSREEAMLLFGSRDQFLREIRTTLGVQQLVGRGDQILIKGTDEQIALAERVFPQLRHDASPAGQPDAGRRQDRPGGRQQGGEPIGPTGRQDRRAGQPLRPPADRRPGPLRPGHARTRSDHLHRPGRHRQDLAGGRHGGEHAAPGVGQENRPGPPGRRGRRTPGLSARRHGRQGQSLPAASLRRPQRHDGARTGQALHGERHHRDRAAGLHARPNPQPSGHHPRRRAEHDRSRR